MPPKDPTALSPIDQHQRLLDRAAITDVLHRYARGVDRKMWPLVRSAYHADATDDHGSYSGSIDGFVAFLEQRHAMIAQSIHILGNIGFEFLDKDRALVETYFTCHQRMLPEAGKARLAYLRGQPLSPDEAVENESIGRYIDIFERRGEWRIASRKVVFDVYRSWPAPADGGLSRLSNVARRDEDDAILVIRRSFGLG
jgi:hypothetical protein